MSTEAEILGQRVKNLTSDCSKEIAEDIEGVLSGGTVDIAGAETDAIGGEKVPTAPLSAERIRVKRKFGGISPQKPRVMSGMLMASIFAEPIGTFDAHVLVAGDQQKAETQQRGSRKTWVDEDKIKRRGTRARPYFGISADALQECERLAEEAGKQIEAAFTGSDDYPAMKITI